MEKYALRLIRRVFRLTVRKAQSMRHFCCYSLMLRVKAKCSKLRIKLGQFEKNKSITLILHMEKRRNGEAGAHLFRLYYETCDNLYADIVRVQAMKQKTEIEEKQTVHVVLKYMSRCLLQKGVGGRVEQRLPPLLHRPISHMIHGFSFKDDVVIISPLRCFLYGTVCTMLYFMLTRTRVLDH